MRTELIISLFTVLLSALLLRFLSLKRISTETFLMKRFIAGILSWIFIFSTAAWMILFGDTFTAWLTSPEEELFSNILINAIAFLCIYILSFRSKSPYPVSDILDYALVSLSFQSVTSISTNKLIMFLRKRAFEQFLHEVQPDSRDQIIQQREHLIQHLHQQLTITDGLKQLENGTTVDIIDAHTSCPTMLSQHPFFKYLTKLTVNPKERKAKLQLVYPQIEESIQNDIPVRTRFLRQVYDFVQTLAHEPFIKQYAQFFDLISLSIYKAPILDTKKTTEKPIFFFEISTTVLQKIESTYINPSKLETIATLQFQPEHTQPSLNNKKFTVPNIHSPHQKSNIFQHPSTRSAA